MNRLLVSSLVIGIVSGCGSQGSAASPTPSANPTVAASTPAPTVAVTGRPTPSATATATSGGRWPQSTREELLEAQRLADAGDPAYTWQLDASMAAGAEPWRAEIFSRFFEEVLGWEEFAGVNFGYGYSYEDLKFIRCASGRTNPLGPLYEKAPEEIRRCAPTIDDNTYETAWLKVSQAQRMGSSGIWVVDGWELLESRPDPSFFSDPPEFFSDPGFHDYAVSERAQVGQVTPPSDAEVNALFEAFLEARVEGQGAEEYLFREPDQSPDRQVPLVYAATSGAPYQRYEIERVHGPVWPGAWTGYKVRLFTAGGTEVEQRFTVVRHDGQLGVLYGDAYSNPTTENGQPFAVPYSLLGGEVTFAAAPPWIARFVSEGDTYIRLGYGIEKHVVIGTDPLPACENVSPPADAEALAQMIMDNPNSETTGTLPVRIAGLDALQMDVDVNELDVDWNDSCWGRWGPDQFPQWRTRLYMIDYPGEAGQILAIAVNAPEEQFEGVLDRALPIVESLEFHVP